MRINFYLLRTFPPHLGSFLCRFFFHYVSAKFHLWPSLGDLPRPRIGMLSLVTVSPVITAFHSCGLSHHVFDQVNLWPAWVGFETASDNAHLEPKRLNASIRCATIKDGIFGLINPYLVFQSRVRTEFFLFFFFVLVFNWNHFEMRLFINSQIKKPHLKMIPIKDKYTKLLSNIRLHPQLPTPTKIIINPDKQQRYSSIMTEYVTEVRYII